MPIKRLAVQTQDLYLGAREPVSVDFSPLLDAGELLTGTPQLTDSSGLLDVTDAQVSSADLSINNKRVLAGAAVQFFVDRNDAPDGEYEIDIVVDSTAGAVKPGAVCIKCV